LVRSLRHPEFTAARLDTGFYERHLDALVEAAPEPAPASRAASAPAAAREASAGYGAAATSASRWRQ
ncbi:hypothetical protein EF912_29310, partial [Streptomyces sp. WAC07061]